MGGGDALRESVGGGRTLNDFDEHDNLELSLVEDGFASRVDRDGLDRNARPLKWSGRRRGGHCVGVKDGSSGGLDKDGFEEKAVGGFLDVLDDASEFRAEALKLEDVGGDDAFGHGVGLNGKVMVIGPAFVVLVVDGDAGALDANEFVDLGVENEGAKGMNLGQLLGELGKGVGAKGEAFALGFE